LLWIRRLLWLEPFYLLAWMPLILFPARLLPVPWQPAVVLALFAFWPLRWLYWRLANGRWIVPLQTPLSLAMLLLLFWLPVNIWAAVDAVRAWEIAGYLLLGVTLFVALVNWPPMLRHPEWLVWPLIAFASVLALVGPLLLTTESVLPGALIALQRVAAPFVSRLGETINPNILAGTPVVLLPLAVALGLPRHRSARGTRSAGRRLLQAALWVVAGLMFGVILLTGSRGAVLAVAISLPLVLCLRWPRLLWGIVLLGILAGLWGWGRGDMGLLDRLSSGGAIGGLDERVEIWSRALYAIQDFSFTGVGLGAFNQVIPLLYPYFLIAPSVDIPHAHNLMLQVAVDLGTPGLIAWLAILMIVMVQTVAVLRRGPSSLWALGAGVLGGLVAMLVHGLLDATLWGTKLAFLPWLLFALAVLAEAHASAAATTKLSGGV
jgi:putative inorganic carbon (HCO3(-)) transporter